VVSQDQATNIFTRENWICTHTNFANWKFSHQFFKFGYYPLKTHFIGYLPKASIIFTKLILKFIKKKLKYPSRKEIKSVKGNNMQSLDYIIIPVGY
jgi:hypothetical protein